jgi:hypothetical protein
MSAVEELLEQVALHPGEEYWWIARSWREAEWAWRDVWEHQAPRSSLLVRLRKYELCTSAGGSILFRTVDGANPGWRNRGVILDCSLAKRCATQSGAALLRSIGCAPFTLAGWTCLGSCYEKTTCPSRSTPAAACILLV